MYAAADTVAQCAARVRAQQSVVSAQRRHVAWWGVAAFAFRARLDEASAALNFAAVQLDAFAAQILRAAAALQLESAVRH